MTIRHVFSNPVADGAATTVVRPSDWNSAHVQAMTLSGNTAGVSEISGHNIVLQGGSNVTLSGAMAGTMASLVILAGGGSAAQFALVDSNGISFGTNGSQVTASYTVPSVPAQSVQTQNLVSLLGSTGNISLANGNGISFGGNASTITASHNGLTTARASNDAVGLNTALTANGVSWTVNSAGLSLNVPAFLTTAAQSGHSHGNPTLALTNLSGTTASASNGLTLSLSAAAPGAAAEANWMTLGGNVLGNSSASGSTIQIIGGNNITVSGLNNSQIRIDGDGGGGAGYTALSIQNRQLGASTTLNSGGGQNSLWLSPLRVGVAVSASTLLAEMISYSGTITSAATAQAGQTIRAGIWSQLTDPASTTRFDTWWTGAASLTFWNSGTSSVSYAYSQSGGQTTGSSAGSNLMTASVI